jgi:hypothetical protein
MAEGSQYEASLREQQVAMSMLAHAARRDTAAMMASLDAIADPGDNLRATHVIGALLTEFQKGMDDFNAEELARWFSGEARELAARASDAV